MNQLLPDWMFAAFAIGAWTLGGWVNSHWHWPMARWIAAAIAALCVLVIAIRYVIRFFRRLRTPRVEDPDEWRNY